MSKTFLSRPASSFVFLSISTRWPSTMTYGGFLNSM